MPEPTINLGSGPPELPDELKREADYTMRDTGGQGPPPVPGGSTEGWSPGEAQQEEPAAAPPAEETAAAGGEEVEQGAKEVPSTPDFFSAAVRPIVEEKIGRTIPPERIPPPPPLDHERYLTDPDYAKAYMAAVALYNQAVSEARQKQIEARLARFELSSLGENINKAFATGVSPFLDMFQTPEEKAEIVRAVVEARDSVTRSGRVETMADPAFWASVAASAAARSGALFRARAPQQQPREFRSYGQQVSQGAVRLTEEERRLAAEFGLTEEEWIANMREGT